MPVTALSDNLVPDGCYAGKDRSILDVKGKSLAQLRRCLPELARKYKDEMAATRSSRILKI